MRSRESRKLDRAVERLYTGYFARLYDPLMWLVDQVAARQAWRDLLDRAQLKLTAESDILDAACGTGRNLDRLLKRGVQFGSYLGIDRSDDMLKIARRRFGNHRAAAFQLEDLKHLNLDRSFDIILCSWVLSHMDDPEALIHTLRNHLREGGTLLLLYLQEPGANPGLAPTIYRFVFRHVFHAWPAPRRISETMCGISFHKSYFGGLVAVTEIERDFLD